MCQVPECLQPTNLPLDDSHRRMQRIFDISPLLPSRHIVRRIINCLTTSSPLSAHNQFSIFKATRHAVKGAAGYKQSPHAAHKRGAFCAVIRNSRSIVERLLSFSSHWTEYVLV